MAFQKKEWQNRQVEYTNRRRLTFVPNTGDWKNGVFDIERYEGDVLVEGDLISAQNLNNLENRIESAFNNLDVLNLVYPVGSIYMSVVNASPQSFLGGTWVAISNKFLFAAGGDYSVGATGGEYTHTLETKEIPSHSHTSNVGVRTIYTGSGFSGYGLKQANGDGGGSTTLSGTSGSSGGGQAHNNMPPYLVVYMWQRTA